MREDGSVSLSTIDIEVIGQPRVNDRVQVRRYEDATARWRKFRDYLTYQARREVVNRAYQSVGDADRRMTRSLTPYVKRFAEELYAQLVGFLPTNDHLHETPEKQNALILKVNDLLDRHREAIINSFKREVVQRGLAEQINREVCSSSSPFRTEVTRILTDSSGAPNANDILPNGTKFVRYIGPKTLIVVEQPPQTRTISCSKIKQESTR